MLCFGVFNVILFFSVRHISWLTQCNCRYTFWLPVRQVSSIGARGPSPSTVSASGAMEPWRCRIEDAVWLLLAPATRAAYDSNVHAFLSCCRGDGFPVGWPASVDAILAYCMLMFEAGLASDAMGGSLVAITFKAQYLGFPDPCRDF